MKFSISARRKREYDSILTYLTTYFSDISLDRVTDVFGFVEFCTMYGGRPFSYRELSDIDIKLMYDRGINLKLPLTNHSVSYSEYKQYTNLLHKYHKSGNTVIVVVDELAKWIKNDFPLYSVNASAIKDISTVEQIDAANGLYDSVTLPMRFSQNFEFLSTILDRNRIILFGNASCGINCPKVLCYETISKSMKTTGVGFNCSKLTLPRDVVNLNFDISRLNELGFSQFKLLNYKYASV